MPMSMSPCAGVRSPSLLPFDNYTRRTVPLGGVYSLDLETERTYVLASLRLAQELFSHPAVFRGLSSACARGADAEQVRQALARLSGDDYRVRTRHELRASFYRIMTYEKWGIFFISLLVLVIASFSVVGALAMLIVDKRRDIVTLRALGADTSLVRAIFRSEGLLICGLGAACGALLGVGLSLFAAALRPDRNPGRNASCQELSRRIPPGRPAGRAGGLRPCRLCYFEHYRAQHGET